jgi:hypothetical protein
MRRIVEVFRAMFRAMLGSRPSMPPPPLHAPAISTGDPELDPLVSFLRVWFAREIEAGKALVIEDRTALDTFFMGESYQAYVDSLLKMASGQVSAEMMRDLGDKNRESSAVWPGLTQYVPADLLSREENRAIFEGDLGEGWKRFYRKYPNAVGLIIVSRVGLNSEKDRAVFYMACIRGALSAVGQMHVLQRENDVWIKQPVWIRPLWVS